MSSVSWPGGIEPQRAIGCQEYRDERVKDEDGMEAVGVQEHARGHSGQEDVMSLDRWVDAIQRIDSPEYIELLY